MKHVFALYCEFLSRLLISSGSRDSLCIQDESLYNRVTKILRLRAHQEIILFDGRVYATCKLLEKTHASKNYVWVQVLQEDTSTILTPTIDLYVGLTKKDAFEIICYVAAQMGVSVIQPVLFEKVQRDWGGQKEHTRLKTIMIGACEQAKQYMVPELREPCMLKDLKSENFGQKSIFFDDQGVSFSHLASFFIKENAPKENLTQSTKIQKLSILCGPEGGLTERELEVVKTLGFESYALTPTILRTQEAITVGVGALRSLFIM